MASIPKIQYGFRFDKASRSLKLVENLPVAVPRASQLLVKVEAAGLCHSDLHVLDGLDVGDHFVMGHEIYGHVVQVGDGVPFAVGDKVAAFGPNACGRCEMCRLGRDNDCTTNASKWFGLGNDGGYQEYLLVENTRNLVKVPDGVPAPVAAAVTDAMLTPYHAIKAAGLGPHKRALFVGAGGLGTTAVQIAKAFGAHVTVVDRKPSALALAKSFGADETYTDLPAGSGPYDACLDFVAVQSTFDLCQKLVKLHGALVPVGLGADRLLFDLADLALREVQIMGSFWGTSGDLAECFELARLGKIAPKVTTRPLRELPQCVEQLRAGHVEGRLVLIP